MIESEEFSQAESEPRPVDSPLFRRHHHQPHPRPTDEVTAEVQKWFPGDALVVEQSESGFAVTTSDGFVFPGAESEEAAWENAFEEMQAVNAYYLSGPPDCQEGTPLENWLEAAGNIEDGPEQSDPAAS
jgi:hypothetical protein